ncbi:MAG: prepilin-type N-terminal cleavage/methylation domain-containing protein, partial [Tepidisphaeraceae bacterium]
MFDKSRNRSGGFSLAELLVVIGIIGILIGLLMPSLSKARAKAQTVQCQSNLRQLGVILHAYVNENRGWLFPVGPDGMDGKPTTLGTNKAPHERWPMYAHFSELRNAPFPPPYDTAAYPGSAAPYDPVTYPAGSYTPKVML